jgi:hypothetical protein
MYELFLQGCEDDLAEFEISHEVGCGPTREKGVRFWKPPPSNSSHTTINIMNHGDILLLQMASAQALASQKLGEIFRLEECLNLERI